MPQKLVDDFDIIVRTKCETIFLVDEEGDASLHITPTICSALVGLACEYVRMSEL